MLCFFICNNKFFNKLLTLLTLIMPFSIKKSFETKFFEAANEIHKEPKGSLSEILESKKNEYVEELEHLSNEYQIAEKIIKEKVESDGHVEKYSWFLRAHRKCDDKEIEDFASKEKNTYQRKLENKEYLERCEKAVEKFGYTKMAGILELLKSYKKL